MNKLNHHLRQYRHNNDDGLIMGYEQEATEAFVCCLEQENAELKAMVEHLKEFIGTQSDYCFDRIEINGQIIKPKVLAHEAVWKTPAQCLASVKAGAIDDAAKWLSPETLAGEEGCDLLRQYANKLREGKS